MAKRKNRKPDLRRIRTSKTYTLPEIAKTLDRNVATVRSWVRQGLPLLSEQKPLLVLGSDLKRWLQKKWKEKARKCQPGELFCFRCRAPKRPKLGSVAFVPRNAKTVMVKGRCVSCGTQMNQTRSLSKLTELQWLFGSVSLQLQNLTGFYNSSDNQTSGNQPSNQSKKL